MIISENQNQLKLTFYKEEEMTEKELTAHELAIELLKEENRFVELEEIVEDLWDAQLTAAYFLTKCHVPEKAHPNARTALIKFFASLAEEMDEDRLPLSIEALAKEALRKFGATPELKKAFLESEEGSITEGALEALLEEMGEEIPEREKKSV